MKSDKIVTIEDAIFREESAFVPGNLNNHREFWETVILKDHPYKTTLLGWLPGVKLSEFMNSFTSSTYQGVKIHSVYPKPAFFENYVPEEYEGFVTTTLKEWENLGDIQRVTCTPVVVCPIGIESSKPRVIWDGRYLNEFIRDIPFSMDSATKVAEVAWKGAYMFKLDHKNGYFHVPIEEQSRMYFGICWQEVCYVLCVLPFGWKSSPYIYHSLTEAVNMYIRSLGIPMLGWIDDMLGMVQQLFHLASDEEQFQSCMRAMVVVSYVMFMAGYFLGIKKCSLIPEQVITYLGIECDALKGRFAVPQARVQKYVPLINKLLTSSWISFSTLEKIVGKLVSLECAVAPGMWYTRELYAALKQAPAFPTDSRRIKDSTFIKNTPQIKEELAMWKFLLLSNQGAPWRSFENVFVQADISSDASGRKFAGIIDIQKGPILVTAGDFEDNLLEEDIQIKEGEALKQTLLMAIIQIPEQIKGKTLLCKVDNQVLKAVLDKKGTSANLKLNNIGKKIFWLQQLGDFHLTLSYIPSGENRADQYTRQSRSLEATLDQKCFLKIWKKWGPFQWDLMASAANVRKDPEGKPLRYFSRYFDSSSNGVDLFTQRFEVLSQVYCFPPLPIIGMVVKCLQQNKLNCVLVIPATNEVWVNLISAFVQDVMVLSRPYDGTVFTVLSNEGRRKPKKYSFSMLAVKLDFDHPCKALHHLFL